MQSSKEMQEQARLEELEFGDSGYADYRAEKDDLDANAYMAAKQSEPVDSDDDAKNNDDDNEYFGPGPNDDFNCSDDNYEGGSALTGKHTDVHNEY